MTQWLTCRSNILKIDFLTNFVLEITKLQFLNDYILQELRQHDVPQSYTRLLQMFTAKTRDLHQGLKCIHFSNPEFIMTMSTRRQALAHTAQQINDLCSELEHYHSVYYHMDHIYKLDYQDTLGLHQHV